MFVLKRISSDRSTSSLEEKEHFHTYPLNHQQKESLQEIFKKFVQIDAKDNSFTGRSSCQKIVETFLESSLTLWQEIQTEPKKTVPRHKITLRGSTNSQLILSQKPSADVDVVIKVGITTSRVRGFFKQYCESIATQSLHRLFPKIFKKKVSYTPLRGFEKDPLALKNISQQCGIFSAFKIIEEDAKCIFSFHSNDSTFPLENFVSLDITFQFLNDNEQTSTEEKVGAIGRDSLSFAHDAVELVLSDQSNRIQIQNCYFSPLFGHSFHHIQMILEQRDLIILNPDMFGGYKRYFYEITKGKIPSNDPLQQQYLLGFFRNFFKTPIEREIPAFFDFLIKKSKAKSPEFIFRIVFNSLQVCEILNNSLPETDSSKELLHAFSSIFMRGFYEYDWSHLFPPHIIFTIQSSLLYPRHSFWNSIKNIYGLKAHLDIHSLTHHETRLSLGTTLHITGSQTDEDSLLGYFITPKSSLETILTWNEELKSSEEAFPLIKTRRASLLEQAPEFFDEVQKCTYLYFINRVKNQTDPEINDTLPILLHLLIDYPSEFISRIPDHQLLMCLKNLCSQTLSTSSLNFLTFFTDRLTTQELATLMQLCTWIDNSSIEPLDEFLRNYDRILERIFQKIDSHFLEEFSKCPEHLTVVLGSHSYHLSYQLYSDFITQLNTSSNIVTSSFSELFFSRIFIKTLSHLNAQELSFFITQSEQHPDFHSLLRQNADLLENFFFTLVTRLYENYSPYLPNKKMISLTDLELLTTFPQHATHQHVIVLWDLTLNAPIDEDQIQNILSFLENYHASLPEDYSKRMLLKLITQFPYPLISQLRSQEFYKLVSSSIDTIITKISRIKKNSSFPKTEYSLLLEYIYEAFYLKLESSPSQKILNEELLTYSQHPLPSSLITQHLLSLPPTEKTWSSIRPERLQGIDFSEEELQLLISHFSPFFYIVKKLIGKGIVKSEFLNRLPSILKLLENNLSLSEDAFSLLKLSLFSTNNALLIKELLSSFTLPKKISPSHNLSQDISQIFSHLFNISQEIAFSFLIKFEHYPPINTQPDHFILINKCILLLNTPSLKKEKEIFLLNLIKKSLKIIQEKDVLQQILINNVGSFDIIEELLKQKKIVEEVKRKPELFELLLKNIGSIRNENGELDILLVLSVFEKLGPSPHRFGEDLLCSLSPKNLQEHKKISSFLFFYQQDLSLHLKLSHLSSIELLIEHSKKQDDTRKSTLFLIEILSQNHLGSDKYRITEILSKILSEKGRLQKNNSSDIDLVFTSLEFFLKQDENDFNDLCDFCLQFLQQCPEHLLTQHLSSLEEKTSYSQNPTRIVWSFLFLNKLKALNNSDTQSNPIQKIYLHAKTVFKIGYSSSLLPELMSYIKEISSINFVNQLNEQKRQELSLLLKKQISKIDFEDYFKYKTQFISDSFDKSNLLNDTSRYLFSKYQDPLLERLFIQIYTPETYLIWHRLELMYTISHTTTSQSHLITTQFLEKNIPILALDLNTTSSPMKLSEIFAYIQLLALYQSVSSNPKLDCFRLFFDKIDEILQTLSSYNIETRNFKITYPIFRNLFLLFKTHPCENLSLFLLPSLRKMHKEQQLSNDQLFLSFNLILSHLTDYLNIGITSPKAFYEGITSLMSLDQTFLRKNMLEPNLSLVLRIFEYILIETTTLNDSDIPLSSAWEFVINHALTFIEKTPQPQTIPLFSNILILSLNHPQLQIPELIEKSKTTFLFLGGQKQQFIELDTIAIKACSLAFSPQSRFEKKSLTSLPSYNRLFFEGLFDTFYSKMPCYLQSYSSITTPLITTPVECTALFFEAWYSFFMNNTIFLQTIHMHLLEALLINMTPQDHLNNFPFLEKVLAKTETEISLGEISTITRGFLGIFSALQEKESTHLTSYNETIILPYAHILCKKIDSPSTSFYDSLNLIKSLGLLYIHTPEQLEKLLLSSTITVIAKVSSIKDTMILHDHFMKNLILWLETNDKQQLAQGIIANFEGTINLFVKQEQILNASLKKDSGHLLYELFSKRK